MKKKDYTNSFILKSLGMPLITDFQSLSDNLAINKRTLYLMSMKSKMFYSNFAINKKDGSKRQIFKPKYSLKLVQKWILSEILEKVYLPECALAFKKGKGSSIRKNAEVHRYSTYIYQIDLKDFFTTIKIEKVFYIFRNLGYSKMVSNIFANLCTLNDYLPQGADSKPRDPV